MKKLFTLSASMFLLLSVFAQTDSAEITFLQTRHDFGTLKKSGHTTATFEFQNTGKIPLMISRCQSTCGCTTPHCPTEAIQPGAKSFVQVHYYSLRIGSFTKPVTVYSNATTPNLTLTISGTIVEESDMPKPVKRD